MCWKEERLGKVHQQGQVLAPGPTESAPKQRKLDGYVNIRIETLPVLDCHWPTGYCQERKNYRECSNIKAQVSPLTGSVAVSAKQSGQVAVGNIAKV